MHRINRWFRSFCLMGALATPAAADDFRIFVVLPSSPEIGEKYGRNFEKLINFEGSPLDQDGFRVLNAGAVGRYPFGGIHLVEANPNYMEEHFQRMRTDLYRWIAPDFDGYALIDYESWWAAWDHTQNTPPKGPPGPRDKDFKDQWIKYLEEHRPAVLAGKTGAAREQVLRETYEQATVPFLVETLREAKRLVPNAKWGYYNYPMMLYNSVHTPGGVIGYGDNTHYASEINDRLAPLWAEMDVTAPRLYPPRDTVLDRKDGLRENTPEQQYEFLASIVREAKRVAPDVPCVPFGGARYYGAWALDLSESTLSERNTWMQFTVPYEAGADGICIWGDATTDEMAHKIGNYINNVAIPIASEFLSTWFPEGSSAKAPSGSGAASQRGATAGGKQATPAYIPAHVRTRYSRAMQEPKYGAVRQGATRISVPSHGSSATASSPIHRGARIVGRRATSSFDAPPQHLPAPGSDKDEDGDASTGD